MPSRSRKSSAATICSPSGRRGCGGFTLLEVLVALAVLGIGLGVIFQGLGLGLRLRAEASENVALAVVAERLLGGLPTRKTAPASPEEGEEDGVRWRLEALGAVGAPAGAGNVVAERRGAELVEVLLTVTAPSGHSWELRSALPPAAAEGAP